MLGSTLGDEEVAALREAAVHWPIGVGMGVMHSCSSMYMHMLWFRVVMKGQEGDEMW